MLGYVALGSNLGDRLAHLRFGLRELDGGEVRVTARSSIWETEPVGTADPSWFLNMVARIETSLAPLPLLDLLLGIELRSGRRRTVPNAPRTLDLDLLMLGETQWSDSRLTLPHPRMWDRRFVLEPLRELVPGLTRPGTGETIDAACRRLGASPAVRRAAGTAAALDPRSES